MNAMKRNHTTEQFPKGPYAQALKMVGLTHAKEIVVDRWLVNMARLVPPYWSGIVGVKTCLCRRRSITCVVVGDES